LIDEKKLKNDEIKKKIQFYKLFQIKQIIIKKKIERKTKLKGWFRKLKDWCEN